ncbi:MAG: accessory gene regulator ArgB-like protein [Candidatus Gastranaerophilaceae bacterium]
MFAKVSEKFTQQLESCNAIDPDKRELYKYGFQQGLILALNFFTSVFIGVLFGMILECILLLAAYIPLRSYSGGLHSNSSEKCYVVSTLITIIWLAILKTEIMTQFCCVILLIIGAAVCFILSPVEDKNKPLDDDEYTIYRKRSLAILFIEICIWVSCTFIFHKFREIIPLTVFSEAVMLSFGKIKNNIKYWR